jgi:hypothetical protein
MLVLFDQGTPVGIRAFLRQHTVHTTAQRGWDNLRNGDLLKVAEDAGFEVLVTPDKNIRHQQNSRWSCWAMHNGRCCEFMWTGLWPL